MPSKPCHIWGPAFPASFKTLSHLGVSVRTVLQNPVTSGRPISLDPSKPCHIWGGSLAPAFKTLSHLGLEGIERPSKPCHIWGAAMKKVLQNPVTSGGPVHGDPSKPCHIWVGIVTETFKTLSHLGTRPTTDLQNPVTSGRVPQIICGA